MASTGNTGKKVARYLEKYYVATGLPVLDESGNPIRKPNKKSDPDYVPPILDYCDCPDGLHDCIPTTTTSTSTTSTTTIPSSCDLTGVTWLTIIKQCNGATTNVTIGVNDTARIFEFYNPISQQFEQATIGNNKITFTVPSDGQTYSTHFRVKGCVNQVQGGFDSCIETTTSTTTTTQQPNSCDLTGVVWTNVIRQCNGSTTDIIIGVSDNVKVFEFYNPISQKFERANLGNNRFTLTVPSDGQTYSTHYRIQGCLNDVQGFFTACLENGSTTTSTTTNTTSTSSTSTTQSCDYFHVNLNKTVTYIDCNNNNQIITGGTGSCNFRAYSMITGDLGKDYDKGFVLNCSTTTNSTTTSTTTLQQCCLEVTGNYNCTTFAGSPNVPIHLEALINCLPRGGNYFPQFKIEKTDGTVIQDWISGDGIGGNTYSKVVQNFTAYRLYARYQIGGGNYCNSSPYGLIVNCEADPNTTTTTVVSSVSNIQIPTNIQGMITGENQPTVKNTIRWEQFPDFDMPVDLKVNYLDFPMFKEDENQNISKATLKGWNYTGNSHILGTNFPMSKRADWGNGGQDVYTFSQTNPSIQQMYDFGFNNYLSSLLVVPRNPSTTGNCFDGSMIYEKYLEHWMWDEEDARVAGNYYIILNIAKGIYDRGDLLNPQFKLHLYGGGYREKFVESVNSYYYLGGAGASDWFIPQLPNDDYAKLTTFSQSFLNNKAIISGTLGKVYIEAGAYMVTSYPMTSELYEKDTNGNFLYDTHGERVFKHSAMVTEVVRGEIVRWKNQEVRNINGDNLDIANLINVHNVKPELYWSVWSIYTLFQRQVCMRIALNKMLYNSENIENSLYNNDIDLWVTHRLSNETPGGYNDGTEKQLTPFQIFATRWISLIMIGNESVWSGYSPRGRSANNCGGYTIQEQGLGASGLGDNGDVFSYPMFDPSESIYKPDYKVIMSVEENHTAINYMAKQAAEQFGFFSNDKLFVFSDFMKFKDGECMIVGRYQNSKLLLFICEPHTEIGEIRTYTVSNTKNSATETISINTTPGIRFPATVKVINLPPDYYVGENIKITYLTRKGTTITVSGNLMNH